jgi:phospholipid N-methyltransferase
LQLNDNLMFARTFLRSPRMLGSAIPSSRYLISHLLRHFDWKKAQVVVEYGPGVGTITREMLRNLSADAKLLAIESNHELAAHLKENVDDPRLHTRLTSAANVHKALNSLRLEGADYVISGIPFSTIPRKERLTILRNTWKSLKPGGVFLVYQFSGAVLPSLEEVFGPVHQEFELRNVLPARIFRCEK